MREALLGKLLLLLSQATPEELPAIYRFARRLRSAGPQHCAPASGAKPVPAGGVPRESAEWGVRRAELKGKSPYVFRWSGRHWEVVFDSGRPFRLRNTLGARYLDYLLHEPNEPIRAFDLEVLILPEKGEARGNNSIQPESDSRALREYRQELRRLRIQMGQAAGEPEEAARLEGEIEALKSALKEAGAADTGERAFDNVRKALWVVLGQLRSGGPEEQAFAEHLRTHLSIGFECLYSQSQGRIWG
jgi:hypothetical protein